MRFVDEYRAPEQVMQLIEHLCERAAHLPYTAERPLRIMEVCGGHTHAIFKFGLDQLLPDNVEFIHGPPPGLRSADGQNRQLCGNRQPFGSDFCTFGDAMRVRVNKVLCYKPKRAARISASSIHRWMR